MRLSPHKKRSFLSLQQAVEALSVNTVAKEVADIQFSGVKIDSRQILEGDIFIAIKGEKTVDCHGFIKEAIDKGAVAVIVDEDVECKRWVDLVPILRVPNTEKAFGQLARLWRTKLFTGQVIALTGSNGKTTIKNMLKCVLQTRYKAGSAQGNYNNELGVPITLFELPLDCDYWIVEMGARHIGDIDYLCRIAMPDITLISNIGSAHVGEFGSQDKLLQAKSEILWYGGLSLLDADSLFYESFLQICQRVNKPCVLTIAKESARQKKQKPSMSWDYIAGEAIFRTSKEHLRLKLNCLGEHNVHNAAWAVAVADYCDLSGAEMTAGLKTIYPEPGRLQVIECTDYTIIDDSYNASPESVEALLKLKQSLAGKAIMIWGDMAELGNEEQMIKWHKKIAQKFNQHHIDWVLTYGKYASYTYLHGSSSASQSQTQYQNTSSFAEITQLIQQIITQWQRDAESKNAHKYIYLKASNKMNFSQLAGALSELQCSSTI